MKLTISKCLGSPGPGPRGDNHSLVSGANNLIFPRNIKACSLSLITLPAWPSSGGRSPSTIVSVLGMSAALSDQ